MSKKAVRISCALALGLAGACGSEERERVTPASCISPKDPSCRIAVEGPSLVRWTGPVTDGVDGGVSTAVVRHTPGSFCMSGTVDSGPTGSGWGAILLVGLTVRDEASMGAVVPFDAAARGIRRIRFTVDHLPIGGLLPQIAQLQSADCNRIPDCATTFSLPAYVTTPGTISEPLPAFTQADGTHSVPALDQTLITGVQFYVPSLPGMAYDYDFCVRDLAFIDDAGHEVTP
jgi:hypothetical protein